MPFDLLGAMKIKSKILYCKNIFEKQFNRKFLPFEQQRKRARIARKEEKKQYMNVYTRARFKVERRSKTLVAQMFNDTRSYF